MAQGILTKDTTLSYSETPTGTMTMLTGTQSYPDMGSDPEGVETTTLLDSSITYIDGLSDPGSMQYGMLYIKEEFAALEALRGKTLYYSQEYPDGSKHTFQGQGTPVMAGQGTNAAMSYNYYVKPSTDILFTAAP